MQRSYEVMFIVRPDMTDEDVDKLLQKQRNAENELANILKDQDTLQKKAKKQKEEQDVLAKKQKQLEEGEFPGRERNCLFVPRSAPAMTIQH